MSIKDAVRTVSLMILYSGISLELGSRLFFYMQEDKRVTSVYPELNPFTGSFNPANLRLPSIRTNSVGFRGEQEYSKQPASGITRILVLGGSTAFGFGATKDAEAFPAQLERFLNRSSKSFEVINASSVGFNSEQELALLWMKGLSYSPKVVLFLNGFNDVVQSIDSSFSLDEMAINRDFRKAVSGSRHSWYDHFAFVRLLKQKPWAKVRHHFIPVRQSFLDRYLSNVDKAYTLSVAFGFIPLIVLQPERDISPVKKGPNDPHVFDRPPFPEFGSYQASGFDYLREGITRTHLPRDYFFDASRVLEGTASEIFLDECHLTDKGSALLAEKLAHWIRNNISISSSL